MTSRSPIFNVAFIFSLLTFVVISFQNCSKQFELQEMKNNSLSLSSSSNGTGIPISTKNCPTDSSFDTCIFAKSPVAQLGHMASDQDLINAQIYGVKLGALPDPTILATLDIIALDSSGVPLKSNQGWKFSYANNKNNLSAISAFYYAQDFKNWIKLISGSVSLDAKAIKIITQTSESGYFHTNKEIRLANNDLRIPMAFDGTSVVGYTAQALIAYSSSGKSLINTVASTNECLNAKGLLNARGCCKTKDLCGPALNQGAADYITAVYFGNFGSSIGETWVNSYEGLQHCGISRNPASNASLLASSAFAACSSRNSFGYVYSMASLYSSIWWEARKKSTSQDIFDRFFVRHIALLSGDDNWPSLKIKILNFVTLEPAYKASYDLLISEANLRGL